MTTILITGASNGLGAATARRLARSGNHLALWGRDSERLGTVADECKSLGASVDTQSFDLRNNDLTMERLHELDRAIPIELAILNAGIGGSSTNGSTETPERAHQIANVNFTSTVVAATAIGMWMKARGHGHIVIIGSVAASFPLPMAPAYSGAKAGLAMFAEALDLRLRPAGVAVTLVSPGFIDTAMSRQLATPKPFMLGVDEAAAIIARAIAKKPRHLVFPWQMALLCTLSRWLPRAVTRMVLRRF